MTPLIQHFGLTRLRDIDQCVLDTAAATLYPRAKPQTRRRQVHAPFIACWNTAVAAGKAQPRQWRRPDAGKRRLVWLTPSEAEALLAVLPAHTRALVTFYLGAGARASEALNLVWGDLSPAAHRVQLWADLTKAGADRWVDLPQRVRAALPQRGEPAAPVFLNARGVPWHAYDAINLALRRACVKTGVRHISCHALRHSWATWFYAVTRNLEALMQQGGWASPELALRYMHGGSDDLTAEVLAHNWEFGGSAPPQTSISAVKSHA